MNINRSMVRFERFIFFVFLILLPFQARYVFARWTFPFNEWTAGFIYGTDLILIVLFVLWIIRGGIRLKTMYASDILLVIGLVLISAISIIQSLEPMVAWFRLLKLIEFSALYLYLRGSLGTIFSLRELFPWIVVSGFIQACIGIAQSITQSGLGLRLLGESPLIVGNPGIAVFLVDDGLFLRAYGTTPHPNIVAAWLMLGIWGLFVWYIVDQNKLSWLKTGMYAVMLFGFYATFSRIIIAVWACTIAVSLIFVWSQREALRRFIPALKNLFIVTILISISFSVLYWPQVKSRITISAHEEAVINRLLFAELAGDITQQNFVFGVGIGQFVPYMMETFPFYESYLYQPAHSIYLLASSELGIIGLVVLLMIIIFIMHQFWKRERNPARRALLCIVFAGMLLIAVFDHFFWTIHQGGLMLWMVFGIMSALSLQTVHEESVLSTHDVIE